MLELAKKVAMGSRHSWANHAAVVTKGGAVQNAAGNTPNRHAERIALERLWPSKRKGTKVLSIRVRADGSLGMAKPCDRCMAYLEKNGVTSVTYSTDDGRLERVRVRRPERSELDS